MDTNNTSIETFNAGITAYKLKKWCFPCAMCLFAIFIGWLSTESLVLPLGIGCLILYGICLILKPSWILFFLVLVNINFFGWIPEELMRVPGAFKLRDLVLLSLFIPFLLAVAIDKDTVSKKTKSPVKKVLIGLMFFLFTVILYTVIEFEVSFISTTRIPRKYLFYLAFFIVMFLIDDNDDLKILLKVLIALACFQAFLMVIQMAVGGKFAVMPYLALPIKLQNLSGITVPRVYLAGGGALMHFLFGISFWLYHTHNGSSKHKMIYLFLLLFLGLGIFFEFYRTKWFRMFLTVCIPFLFAKPKEKSSVFRQIVFYSFIGIIFFIFVQAFIFDLAPLFGKFFQHVFSAYIDFVNKSGTYAARVQAFHVKLYHFWNRPFFGLGFLHHITATESSKASIITGLGIETTDSEITTLLSTMGVCGAFVFYTLSICYTIRCIKILLKTSDIFYRGIILGCLGYFISGVLTFFSYSFLTRTEEILFVTFSIAFVEKINQFNKRSKPNPPNSEKELAST